LGHWELEPIVSGGGKRKGCVATFIERKTRLYIAIPMPNRTALSMEIAFEAAASLHSAGTFQIATTDRGKEFACWTNLKVAHEVQITLPIRIHLGNADQMKILMSFYVSSFLRKPILLK